MKTYKISFYPGMVLPRPYYVTVDKPTTNYQALLDILADRLTTEGANGLFDDGEELDDCMVTICGNECRRLYTGGALYIAEVTKDDIKYILQEKAGTDNPFGTVDIGFGEDRTSFEDYDETEFDVLNADELAECWIGFCEENDFDVTDIVYVNIKPHRVQVPTERGRIFVVGECDEDLAYRAGFSYCFTSKEQGCDVFSKVLDELGHRREFILIR